MSLSQEEIDAIAKEVVQQIKDSDLFIEKTDFHRDPEQHYQSHENLDRIINFFDTIENNFFRVFAGFIISGVILIAALPFIWKKG